MDHVIPRTKQRDIFRIAVLGDSCVFGQGIEFSETISERLEFLLNRFCSRRGRRYEVLNFGVPGYNTAMESELFRTRVLLFKPDAVILVYVGNDIQLPNFIQSETSPWTLKRLFILDLLSSVLQGRKGEQILSPSRSELKSPTTLERVDSTKRRYSSSIPERYRSMVGWEAVVSSLKAMGVQGHRLSIPMVILCHFHDVNQYLRMDLDRVNQLSNEVYRTAVEFGWLAANPLQFQIRYLNETKQNERAFWVNPRRDPHPNPLLTRIYGLCLYRVLSRQGVVPPGAVDDNAAIARQLALFEAN